MPSIETDDGHAPLRIDGGDLHGITYTTPVPTAQVKSAVLLAGLDADGVTTVVEPAPTRDHTERAIRALGGPVVLEGSADRALTRFQHEGFDGAVPGDPSSAAFLVAAAALTGSRNSRSTGVGLNPSRLHYLEVLARMGVRTERRIEREELGEPVGELWVAPCEGVRAVRVEEWETPAGDRRDPDARDAGPTRGRGQSRFVGASELTVKESDRLAGVAEGIIDLGGARGGRRRRPGGGGGGSGRRARRCAGAIIGWRWR